MTDVEYKRASMAGIRIQEESVKPEELDDLKKCSRFIEITVRARQTPGKEITCVRVQCGLSCIFMGQTASKRYVITGEAECLEENT